MKYRLFGVFIALVIWIGCDDSETLTPSTTPEFKYSLPQGNHEYDAKIVDWYNRGGFYILYKYDPGNVYFDVNSEWREMIYDTLMLLQTIKIGNRYSVEGDSIYLYNFNGTLSNKYPIGETCLDERTGLPCIFEVHGDLIYYRSTFLKKRGWYKIVEPEETYVGKQLEWVEEMFLNFYPDSLLRIGMPMKLILCQGLGIYDYCTFFNNLCISHGDETIESLTLSNKLKIKEGVNSWFLGSRLLDQIKRVMEKKGFFGITDYEQFVGSVTNVPNTECYPSGLIWSSAFSSLENMKDRDLKTYIENFLKYKKEKLEMEPVTGNYDPWDFTGILHPKKDVNGLIRKKYDILVDGLYEIGIDWNALVELYH